MYVYVCLCTDDASKQYMECFRQRKFISQEIKLSESVCKKKYELNYIG